MDGGVKSTEIDTDAKRKGNGGDKPTQKRTAAIAAANLNKTTDGGKKQAAKKGKQVNKSVDEGEQMDTDSIDVSP
jgi:hypothetical protein